MTLEQLPNIGKVNAANLRAAGIQSPEELRALGSREAFLRLRVLDPGACLHLLYGLEGAVRGIPKKTLSPEDKAGLRAFFNGLNG